MYREYLADAFRRLCELLRADEYGFDYTPEKIFYSKKLDLYYSVLNYEDTFSIVLDDGGRISFYETIDDTNAMVESDVHLLASFLFDKEEKLSDVETIINYLVNQSIKYGEISVGEARYVINEALLANKNMTNYFNIPLFNAFLKDFKKFKIKDLKLTYGKIFEEFGFLNSEVYYVYTSYFGFIAYTKTIPIAIIINSHNELSLCYNNYDVNRYTKQLCTVKLNNDNKEKLMTLITSLRTFSESDNIESVRNFIDNFLQENDIKLYVPINKVLYGDYVNVHKKTIRRRKMVEYREKLELLGKTVREFPETVYLFTIPKIGFSDEKLEIKISYEDICEIKVELNNRLIFKAKVKINDITFIKLKNAILYINNINNNTSTTVIKNNFKKIFDNKIIFIDNIVDI